MSNIHPTAIISEGARIGDGTSIGAYSVVGPNVVLGKNNRVASHVVLEGHTTLGDDNVIFQFASVGAMPQDLKFHGEASTLTLGNRNIVREFVTIQPGTEGGGMKTTIGNSNLFMANSHIGHDAIIGNSNIFANSAALAGHVYVGNYVNVGGLSGIHQFVTLGDSCLLGAGSMVSNDVPPFCIGQGDRAKLAGVNVVGLERRGVSADEIRLVRAAYRDLFMGKGLLKERLEEARREYAASPIVMQLIEFVSASKRGVCSLRKKSPSSGDA
ncbi:MAG: acyl-ACP--UDP-N-acetylglucosamine O-acyltransferase [Deltaproteobacteria bacterium]|nr:acyl-ACP--UDP-N-acetylglucosamine O-acyltransferase [Deltaproteobacteria bacterium]